MLADMLKRVAVMTETAPAVEYLATARLADTGN
jgi:hypothetical protein